MKITNFQNFKSYVYVLFRKEFQNNDLYKNKKFKVVGVNAICTPTYAREFVVELENQNNQFSRINLDDSILKEWWYDTIHIIQLYTKEVEEKGESKPELWKNACKDNIYNSLERIVNLMGVFPYDD